MPAYRAGIDNGGQSCAVKQFYRSATLPGLMMINRNFVSTTNGPIRAATHSTSPFTTPQAASSRGCKLAASRLKACTGFPHGSSGGALPARTSYLGALTRVWNVAGH